MGMFTKYPDGPWRHLRWETLASVRVLPLGARALFHEIHSHCGELGFIRLNGLDGTEGEMRRVRMAMGVDDYESAPMEEHYPLLCSQRLVVASDHYGFRLIIGPMTQPREPSEQPGESWVYFLSPINSNMVKIGWTSDLKRRTAELQTGCHDVLHRVGEIPGGRAEEAAIHKRFAHLREHGEWFRYTSEIKAFVMDETLGRLGLELP